MTLKFKNTYAKLPEKFFAKIGPVAVRDPSLIRINHALAEELGLDAEALQTKEGVAIFAGNNIPSGAEPIALAYAGHQFGHFVPQLGDGRAVLLGEVVDYNGQRRDIQLKGSGQTPFSRRGDGRAALGPVIREYIVSEAMHLLGISTTRSLAMVKTGELVRRETMLPGGVITRVASSHVRVGTFEYFAAREDTEGLKTLADYMIDRHYPQAKKMGNKYHAFFESVCDRQASLVSSWMHVGFIHGVMNTDNMAISGETIDYGPCAFMDEYDPSTVFSSIDSRGRYAYGNQVHAAKWNLASLGECMLPLMDDDNEKAAAMVRDVIESFQEVFDIYWLEGMRPKLGMMSIVDGDLALVEKLLELMQKHQADFTLTFRYLCNAIDKESDIDALQSLFSKDIVFDKWLIEWRKRLGEEKTSPEKMACHMQSVNPAFIPRNHLIDLAIKSAVEKDDFSLVNNLIEVLANPYNAQPEYAEYMAPPKPEERIKATFCGT